MMTLPGFSLQASHFRPVRKLGDGTGTTLEQRLQMPSLMLLIDAGATVAP